MGHLIPDNAIQKAAKNPREAISYISSLISSPSLFLNKVNLEYYERRGFEQFNSGGVNVPEKEWDNLIILDACRYDLFRDNHNLQGDLSCVESRGSSTSEWLRANFSQGSHHDTVYVTGNGMFQLENIPVDFHSIDPLYDEEFDWELGTVPPSVVKDAAHRAMDKFPRKRLLIHFVQPHFPFYPSETVSDKRPEGVREWPFWERVREGRVEDDISDLWDAYQQTFLDVQPHVSELLDTLPGRTVVTSDHGNLFGERTSPIPIQEWGHPPGLHVPELVDVPWLVNDGQRKSIVSENPVMEKEIGSSEDVKEKLGALGYVNS